MKEKTQHTTDTILRFSRISYEFSNGTGSSPVTLAKSVFYTDRESMILYPSISV